MAIVSNASINIGVQIFWSIKKKYCCKPLFVVLCYIAIENEYNPSPLHSSSQLWEEKNAGQTVTLASVTDSEAAPPQADLLVSGNSPSVFSRATSPPLMLKHSAGTVCARSSCPGGPMEAVEWSHLWVPGSPRLHPQRYLCPGSEALTQKEAWIWAFPTSYPTLFSLCVELWAFCKGKGGY